MDKKIMALGAVLLILWMTKKPPTKPVREFSYTLLAPPEADDVPDDRTMGGDGSGGTL